jgi:NAD(P)-dependent dehydrogenase (short-subunit alcohol dehydrogenase family)
VGFQLDGRVALVTGATGGIGTATVLALAEAGADICLADVCPKERTQELADRICKMGRRAIAVQVNTSKAEDVDQMVRKAVDAFGGLDILFNNAGIFSMASLEETSEEEWNRILAVNITGTFLCTKRVVPEMKRRGKGKIINTGSIFGAYGAPNCVPYCASKMAVHGLTHALAVELGRYKINVNAIGPGNIVTPINTVLYESIAAEIGKPGDIEAGKRELTKRSYPIGRLGEPTDIANAVVYLASDASDFVTGQILFVDGGYTAL